MTTLDATLPVDSQALTRQAVNAIRVLAAQAVEDATCGHPGLPMGAADLAFVLWTQFLNHDPDAPDWPNRDRFVLSAGHGSMLLYALLHLTGYKEMTLEELKSFRQWGSRTAGHPEYGEAPGIETTTGPLGQGVANGVGMALAEAILGAAVNTSDANLVDHHTYVLCSDGDLMEGVAAEACSLAGHLQVGKLILLYDDNGISIDGSTELAFSSEDVGGRFAAYGWHVQHIDGHDHRAIADAIRAAHHSTRPSIICARTVIGWGAPKKRGTAGVHGSKLGTEELAATLKALKWEHAPYHIPAEIYDLYRSSTKRGREARAAWDRAMAASPDAARHLRERLACAVPANLAKHLPKFEAGKSIATRKASEAVINAIAGAVPSMIGGSADLTGSTNTFIKGSPAIARGHFAGRNFHWGVREHGMAGACNGMALHGGFIPFCATFMTFTDYCRPSIRLAALMKLKVVFVMTHDSIFLGEDGPTHQPVEHLEALRAIPRLSVLRPDAGETPFAWEAALRTDGPTVLSLTRQDLPVLDNPAAAEGVARGAYIVREGARGAADLDLILLATGSELHLAVEAAAALEAEGRSVRVVSMVGELLFERQEVAYRASVLPAGVKRLAVEAGVTRGWYKWVGLDGDVVGLDRFGASAPAERLAEEFGFTPAAVAARARKLLG